MASIQEFARKNLVWILLVLLAAGFALTAWELVIYKHWQGSQLIGFVATIGGIVLALAGIFVSGVLRNIVAVLLVLLAGTGLIGTWEHFEHAPGREREGSAPVVILTNRTQAAGRVQTITFNPNASVLSAPAQENEGNEQRPAAPAATNQSGQAAQPGAGQRQFRTGGFRMPPPPLAPLSLTGLALMAALVVFAKPDKGTVKAKAAAPVATSASRR